MQSEDWLRDLISAAEEIATTGDNADRLLLDVRRIRRQHGVMISGPPSDVVYLAGVLEYIGLSEAADLLLDFAAASAGREKELTALAEYENARGIMAAARGDYGEARKTLENALIDASVTASPFRAVVLANLASVSLHLGDRTAAYRWLQDARQTGLAQRTSALELKLAAINWDLARMTGDTDSFRTAASALAEKAGDILNDSACDDTLARSAATYLARSQLELARSDASSDSLASAVEALEVMAQADAAVFGTNHSESIRIQVNYASAVLETARLGSDVLELFRAQTLFDAIIRRLRDAQGEDSVEYIVALSNFGVVGLEIARIKKSDSLLRECVSVLVQAAQLGAGLLGEHHPIVVSSMANKAAAEFDLARAVGSRDALEEASHSLEASADLVAIVFGASHPFSLSTRQELRMCQAMAYGGAGTDHRRGALALRTIAPAGEPWGYDDEYISVEEAAERVRDRLSGIPLNPGVGKTGNALAPQETGATAVAVLWYLARELVDDQEAVMVQIDQGRTELSLRLTVAPDDMGRIIGRRGRTVQAVRTVVRAAAARDGLDVYLDIVD